MITGALMREGSLGGLGDELPRLAGDRRQGLLSHAARPCWRDHPHAQHALGRPQEIDPSGYGPPAIAGFFKESESLEPLFLLEWRRIAIEPASRDLESEQGEPILQPIKRDEVAVPRHCLLATEIALGAEQAEGIESGDQQMPLSPHHPINLAQQLVRLVVEFERVRQYDKICAVFSERKPMRIGEHLRRFLEIDTASCRDARRAQERALGQADLQGLVDENVRKRA